MRYFTQDIFRKIKKEFLWYFNYPFLRQPKIKNAIHAPEKRNDIVKELKDNDFKVIDLTIDNDEFQKYLQAAQYSRYQNYINSYMVRDVTEKSLEHFLAAKLLELSKDDTYIDIASANSPAPEIYNKLFGCDTFRQDIIYPKGLHGQTIGGDAGHLPVKDGFASKLGLHCSYEHFEQDSDIKFIREAERILKKGGKACIIPFYLFYEYAILTDPGVLPLKGIDFEDDAVLYCLKNWDNRHGRFYDPPHLISRIRNNLGGLKLIIYNVLNAVEITEISQLQFIALLEKT